MGIALSAGLFLYYIFYALPGEGPLPAEIRVEQGESLATVARKLGDQKIVSNGFLFSLLARFSQCQGWWRYQRALKRQLFIFRLECNGEG